MTDQKLRWGILGTANIARKNWQAIRHSGNGVVAAVASRKLATAEQFICDCQDKVPFEERPRAIEGYQTLLDTNDIDAVYIPLPTGLREEWVLQAAAAGKHVVSEKPCAISPARLQSMLEACRQNRVQFMDGVMFRHGERLSRIRSVLDDSNSVGSLRRVTSAFSFRGSEEFFAELIFDDDFSASFFCSFLVESQQWAHLSGTRGALRIDDFVLPYERAETQFKILRERFDVRGCEFRMQPDEQTVTVAEHGHSHATAQETRLFQNFAAAVQSGKFNDAWPEIALQSQQVIDACIRSASLGQPCSVAS